MHCSGAVCLEVSYYWQAFPEKGDDTGHGLLKTAPGGAQWGH